MSNKELERIMKALANRRRLSIVAFLKKRKEATVGDIAEEIKLSFRSTSKHLGVLTMAGILEREQRSIQMYYKVASDIPAPARIILSVV
ncbi:MAG: metalloregulator ArsR/SmtB family transcription factor [Candidatus Kaiserbacteria bacterium]|nr:metalloregulator ArsR/SmtB family transcription factor [Candidatus Kaiserbacteria bacterium]